MKIKYLGHSSFLITSDSGVRIVTDPYTPGGGLRYGKITEPADIVTVSHGHSDHNNTSTVGGSPKIVRASGELEVKGIKVKGVPAYHDEAKGRDRGNDIIFCFEIDGMRLCHLGDLGHQLDNKQVAELGVVDILFIPVGGYFTIDAAMAVRVSEQIKPKVIIPMHYKTAKCDYPISGVDEFLKGKTGINRLDTSETQFKCESLPGSMQIMVLKPAL